MQVWVVPCGPRPDKPNMMGSAIDRMVMCELAVNSIFSPQFPVKISNIETHQPKAMFTYDMLSAIKCQNPMLLSAL